MGLRERALKAAEEQQERMEKNKKEAAEKFAVEAKKEFQEMFGEVSELNVEPISENKAKIIADGLSFIAIKKSKDFVVYIDFYPQIECIRCGKLFTYDTPCKKLADIGFLLMKPVVCDACLYGNVDIPPATKSPAERVLELLGEILDILEAECGE